MIASRDWFHQKNSRERINIVFLVDFLLNQMKFICIQNFYILGGRLQSEQWRIHNWSVGANAAPLMFMSSVF